MISSITIGNFKAFADPQTLPLKPITLIFGANSSGKSSIIHSMLLANEALTNEKLNLDIFLTKLGGESVDLGGFRQFVNRRDSSKNVLLGFEIEKEKLPDRLKEIFFDFKTITLIVEIGIYKYFSKINDNDPKILSFEVKTDHIEFIKMSMKHDGLKMDFINIENQIVKNIFEGVLLYTTSQLIGETDIEIFKEALSELVPLLNIKMGKFIPSGLIGIENYVDPRKSQIELIDKKNRNVVLKNVLTNLTPFILDELMKELSRFMEEKFQSLNYLGPLRSYPERHFNLSKSKDKNWKAGGGYAWDVVSKENDIREKVNQWLSSEKLKQQYELRLVNLLPEYVLKNMLPDKLSEHSRDSILQLILNRYSAQDSPDEFFNSVIEELESKEVLYSLPEVKVEDIEPPELPFGLTTEEVEESSIVENEVAGLMDFEIAASEYITDFLKMRGEELADLVLFDKNSNTQVSPRDVGIGISQVLPVLVSAFASKQETIAIEQPEIHLHPALQAELGDLFINSALGGNKNTFILETHSEHLILRVMRRIRETTEGTLKEGLTPIRPEDVQVVFVKPGEKGAEIFKLEVNAEGDFNNKWPDGFFSEREEELF